MCIYHYLFLLACRTHASPALPSRTSFPQIPYKPPFHPDWQQGESSITGEHIQNNRSVRDMLGQRGIKPENLPPSEDIKKLERRVKSQEKKIAAQAGKLPDAYDNSEEKNNG